MDYEDTPDILGDVAGKIGPAPQSPGAIAWPSTREEYRRNRALWEAAAGPTIQHLTQERLNPISTGQAQGLLGPELTERTSSPEQYKTEVGPATPNLPPDIIEMRSRFNGRTGFPPEMSQGGVLRRHPMDPGVEYTQQDAERLNQYKEVQPGAQPGQVSRTLDLESPVSPFQRDILNAELKRRSSPYFGMQRGSPESFAMRDQLRAAQYADSLGFEKTSPEWQKAYSDALGYAVGASSRPMAEPTAGGVREASIQAGTKAMERKPGQIDRGLDIRQQQANTGDRRADTAEQDMQNRDARGNRALDLKAEGLEIRRQHDRMVQQRLAEAKAKGATDADLKRQKFEFDKQFKTMVLRGYLHKQGVLSSEDDAASLAEILSFATGEPAYVNPGGWFSSPSPSRTQEEGGRVVGEQQMRAPKASEEIKKVQPQVQRGAPKPGDIVNGYRFKGGNPNDKGSWEKVE